MVMVSLPPAAASVTGRLLCTTEKVPPETVSAEIATDDDPRLVTVTLAVAALPTDTEPKLTLV